MANITEFNAPVGGIEPSNLGESAYQLVGRRAGALGSERANAIQQGTAALDKGLTTMGDVVLKHAQQHDIMNAVKESSDLAIKADDSLRDAMKNADPNDPNVAKRWRDETLAPLIQQFQDARTTPAGKQFAAEHGARMATEFHKISTADEMTRQGDLADSLLMQTSNNLTTLATRPGGIDLAKSMVPGSIRAMLSQVPGLSPQKQQEAETKWAQKLNQDIVFAGVKGMMDVNPAAGLAAINAGTYDKDLSGAHLEALKGYAREVDQHKRTDAIAGIALQDHQERLADRNAQQQIYQNLQIDPQTHLPIYPENYGQTIFHDPNLLPATKRELQNGYMRDLAGLNRSNQSGAFESMMERTMLPPDDPKRLTHDEVTASIGSGVINPKQAGMLDHHLGPNGPDMGTKSLINSTLAQISQAIAPGGVDSTAKANAISSAKQFFWQQYQSGITRGVPPMQMLDEKSPDYIFKSKPIEQFKFGMGADAVNGVAAATVAARYNLAASKAVDVALQVNKLGRNNDPETVNEILKQGGVNVDVRDSAWCAALVNSALKQAGLDGTGSNLASSFKGWGFAVPAENVQKGDVFYVPAEGYTGHVGFATGAARETNGHMEIQVISSHMKGSPDNPAGVEWRDARGMLLRRGTPTPAQATQAATSPNSGGIWNSLFGTRKNEVPLASEGDEQ